MLYLYISEDYIKRVRNPLKVNGISYSNPTNETLFKLGYLPLEEKTKPSEKKGYCIVPKYVKKTKKIINEWKYVEGMEDEFA